jgi:phosphatidylserine/phosphatidylglycerophosphate/cardiolipin synthase-like enzyme
MKPKSYPLIVCLSFVLSAIGSNAYAADLVLNNVPVKVYFEINDGCTKAIIAELNSAKTEILVHLCSLYPWRITHAISEAHKRGVKVEAIIDKKIIDHSSLVFIRFKHSGIPIFVDETNISANNKIMIVDGRAVITGSFSFNRLEQAERNRSDNVLIIKSGELAKLYAENWNAHRQRVKLIPRLP